MAGRSSTGTERRSTRPPVPRCRACGGTLRALDQTRGRHRLTSTKYIGYLGGAAVAAGVGAAIAVAGAATANADAEADAPKTEAPKAESGAERAKPFPLIGPATGEGPAALDARQAIVNELIKTTPPGSFLYYGYDLVADLANREEAAADLKEQAFAGVWDLLDFGNFAHNDGQSGIGNAL